MSKNKKKQKQRFLENIGINLLMVLLIVFSCEITFATENITSETKTWNLFDNIVSDTLLLLDPDLKKIIADDFNHVVNNSKFQVQVNSWKPRPNPKIKLASIYNNTNSNNIRESFSSLVQPVVEIACTPQKYDPLNEYQSKCIKELFNYPIIETIKIGYTYRPNTTIDQNIANLSGITDKYRYHQIVCTMADIMNGAYEKVSKKNVTKSVNFVKYPLALFAPSVATAKKFSVNDKIIISNEKADLESQISRKRMECHNTKAGSNDHCYKKKKELEALLDELERYPEYYFEQKQVREAKARAQEIADTQDAEIAAQEAHARTTHDMEEQQMRQHQQMLNEMGPVKVLPNGMAINTGSGEFLAPSGSGYVGTQDGTFYTPAGQNGLINTGTGRFTPVVR